MKDDKSKLKSIRVPKDLDAAIQQEANKKGTTYSKIAVKYLRAGMKGIDPATMVKIQNILNKSNEAIRTGSMELQSEAQEGANKLWKSLK